MPASPVVTLRPRREGDDDVLYRIAADLETWEERNPSPPAPLRRATWDARVARVAESGSDDIVFVIDLDGEAVGSASLFAIDSFAGHAEAGIALIPEARGRGIGTEAMRRLVDWAFVRLNLRRVHLEAIASNVGAIRSYEKAGFVIEGRRREHAWVRGAYEDMVLMGILRSER